MDSPEEGLSMPFIRCLAGTLLAAATLGAATASLRVRNPNPSSWTLVALVEGPRGRLFLGDGPDQTEQTIHGRRDERLLVPGETTAELRWDRGQHPDADLAFALVDCLGQSHHGETLTVIWMSEGDPVFALQGLLGGRLPQHDAVGIWSKGAFQILRHFHRDAGGRLEAVGDAPFCCYEERPGCLVFQDPGTLPGLAGAGSGARTKEPARR
jgi:hypothetical protein